MTVTISALHGPRTVTISNGQTVVAVAWVVSQAEIDELLTEYGVTDPVNLHAVETGSHHSHSHRQSVCRAKTCDTCDDLGW